MAERTIEMPIAAETDVIRATRATFGLMQGAGFVERDQVHFATAVSELTRNVVKYANDGTCTLSASASPFCLWARAVVRDYGPGIDNLDRAMRAGYSTGGTFGKGLPGVRNLVDDFEIQTSSSGTEIAVAIERRVPA